MITVRPANEASWDDLQLIFGPRGEPARCQCQWFLTVAKDWKVQTREDRTHRFRERTDCGGEGPSSGLVAYDDGEPAGWCAVEPRTAYPRLLNSKIPWADRAEDEQDEKTWAITCFVTRSGYRRRGITAELITAAAEHAKRYGAERIEGYPMITTGQDVAWPAELYVGVRSAFAKAGFTEVSHPTARRVVMVKHLA